MHDTGERIVIPTSKVKVALLTAGAVLFVAAGIWLFGMADGQQRYPPLYVKAVAVLAAGFFGVCAHYGVRKLFDPAPGLVLDREGIIDRSSGVAAGRVTWQEIRDVRRVSVNGQRFLGIVVDRPENYLGRGNPVRRLFVQLNYRLYGTPIFIASHALKADIEEVEAQIRSFRRRYGVVGPTESSTEL